MKELSIVKLDPKQIDLWLVFFTQIKDQKLLKEYAQLLSDEEHCQMQKFVFPHDKLRYLITRALLRTTLSRYTPKPPIDWSFSYNSHGKPIINNLGPQTRKISFNISHTRDLILLGVTREHELGVDVENINHSPPFDIMDQFFANIESSTLLELSEEGQAEYFYRCWTLKECYLKARGIGLSVPLNLVSFQVQKNKIHAFIDPQLNDSMCNWKFWQFQPASEYVASVCVSASIFENQKIIARSITPLDKEETVDYQFIMSG